MVGEASTPIQNSHISGSITPLAIVVLQDKIRPNAAQTFQWFRDNNVAIKVISGDSASTTSEIARQAGIQGSENYISLENMTLENVKVALYYTDLVELLLNKKKLLLKH